MLCNHTQKEIQLPTMDQKLITVNCWLGVETKMKNYLHKIVTWLALNKLSINVNKTAFSPFGNYCNSGPKAIQTKIIEKILGRTQKTKYLKRLFDYNMQYLNHIENVK